MSKLILRVLIIGVTFFLAGCFDAATRAQIAQAVEVGSEARGIIKAPNYAPAPNNMVPVAPMPTFGGTDQSTQSAPPLQPNTVPMIPPSSFEGESQPVQVQSEGVTATLISQSNGTSVTGLSIVRCFYQYNGQQFERDFSTSCPGSVQIK